MTEEKKKKKGISVQQMYYILKAFSGIVRFDIRAFFRLRHCFLF